MKNIFIELKEDTKKDSTTASSSFFVSEVEKLRFEISDLKSENEQLKKEVEHYKKMLKLAEERIVSLTDSVIKSIAILKIVNEKEA